MNKLLNLLIFCFSCFILNTPTFGIEREIPGGVAERVVSHYKDPNISLRSYAAPNVDGCSGTMIGPNTLMTAAHCNGSQKTIDFTVYSVDDEKRSTQTFVCDYLVHTFKDSDLILFDCPANAVGENPGDKYGYLDFELPLTTSGELSTLLLGRPENADEFYSIWTNPIDELNEQHMIYSEGQVIRTDHPVWSNPDTTPEPCGGNIADVQLGIETDLWNNGGGSGSSQISRMTHRITLGPSSTGSVDARGRQQLAITDYLFFGQAVRRIGSAGCEPTVRKSVNEPYIRSLGLGDTSRYFGRLDKDLNGIFDVQQEIEKFRGENYRPWTWLGFESHRRNAQWTHNGSAVFDTSDPHTGVVHVKRKTTHGNLFEPVLAHERLNLKEDSVYAVQFSVYIESPYEPALLQICLADNGAECETRSIPSGKWINQVMTLKTSDRNDLYFRMTENATMSLRSISLIEQDAMMDFDSNDTRYSWINYDSHTRGLVLPNGRLDPYQSFATHPDWAGVVMHTKGAREGDKQWSLVNEQLGLSADNDYRICFYHYRSTKWPLEEPVTGIVQVLDRLHGVVAYSEASFRPEIGEQRQCTDWFATTSDNNILMFGSVGEQTHGDGAYFVDDITIEKAPRW